MQEDEQQRQADDDGEQQSRGNHASVLSAGWPSALYFVISREIVTGMPEHETVSRTANTESAIW